MSTALHAEHTPPDRTGLGILLVLASVFAMAFSDAVVKLVSANLTVWQVFAVRSGVAIPVLLACLRANSTRLHLQTPRWVWLRSALLVLCWIAFYASLPVLDLSVVAVAAYTSPIMIVLLSAALIGEHVTRRQWAGVMLGFLGMIAILRPGADAFSWFILLPLLAAVCYALAMVLTRSRCRHDSPLVMSLSLHIAFLITGLTLSALLAALGLAPSTQAAYPFLLGDWAPMQATELALLALIGALSALYFLGVARAYQIAPPSIIATFDYAYLVSAALWGFVFFTEIPDAFTIAGMLLITAAGILVAGVGGGRRFLSKV